ncbi:MAG TPA: hypothetical protein PL073_13605 [Spirochaetota bacterium]|nr:hypothetical protein [Spirochaetota bacterium]
MEPRRGVTVLSRYDDIYLAKTPPSLLPLFMLPVAHHGVSPALYH